MSVNKATPRYTRAPISAPKQRTLPHTSPTLNGFVEKDVSPEKASRVSFDREYCEVPAARAGRGIGKGFAGSPTHARNPRTKRSFSGRFSSKRTARWLITQESPLVV